MRYILAIKKADEGKGEVEVQEEEARNTFLNELCTIKGFPFSEVEEATLWREFDTLEEAATDNDKCVYYIGMNNEKSTLRSCSASISNRLFS